MKDILIANITYSEFINKKLIVECFGVSIMSVKFENLKNQNLVVDEIYEGGKAGNTGDDPISKLFPKLGNMSGFRKVKREDDKKN